MSVEQKKKNNSFLIQGAILAVAGIITRLIGLAYRIPVNNILGDEGQGFYGCAFSIYNIALLLTSYLRNSHTKSFPQFQQERQRVNIKMRCESLKERCFLQL